MCPMSIPDTLTIPEAGQLSIKEILGPLVLTPQEYFLYQD